MEASMARMVKVIATSLLGLALTGCVTQEKYNALKLDRDGLAEQLGRSQNEASSARAEADSYKGQLASMMSGMNGGEALKMNLQQQLASMQAQLDEANRRYAEAINRPAGGTALPAPLTNELQQFANQNPDLVDFDAARGIVKFKSDVTFASGDAALTPKAKEVITRFATILNSPAASSYELMVAGHTDNTRVSNPETIKKGNLDNWYLSSHRAISVAAELRGANVNPQRFGVVGYADQRPASSNTSEGGRAANRRVEVLILPTTVRNNTATAGVAAPKAKVAAPNKDSQSVTVDRNTLLNK
jgi:chemotaxis protein MotB